MIAVSGTANRTGPSGTKARPSLPTATAAAAQVRRRAVRRRRLLARVEQRRDVAARRRHGRAGKAEAEAGVSSAASFAVLPQRTHALALAGGRPRLRSSRQDWQAFGALDRKTEKRAHAAAAPALQLQWTDAFGPAGKRSAAP
jgi:hypothetical protein